ncbi:MAG: hypothetical protein IJX89_00385 [Alphaproteobacteria bacterium]|nr:hypothetical protein [Alphaproteobacteria bacterium]
MKKYLLIAGFLGMPFVAGADQTVMFYKTCASTELSSAETTMCSSGYRGKIGCNEYSVCRSDLLAFTSPYTDYPICGAFDIYDYMSEPQYGVILCFTSTTPCQEIIFADSTLCNMNISTDFDPYQASGTTFNITNFEQIECCSTCSGSEGWTADQNNSGILFGGRNKSCNTDGICDYHGTTLATCNTGFYSAAGLVQTESTYYALLDCTSCSALGEITSAVATTNGYSKTTSADCYLPDGTSAKDQTGYFDISDGDCYYE